MTRGSSARQAGVDHALEAGVGHAGVRAEAAVGLLAGDARPAVGGGVDEAAVVDLVGPGLVVELALEVLAPRDEHQRLLQGGVVGRQAGVAQGLDEEGGVRQVGPAVLAAVARPAVEGVVLGLVLPLVPLHRLEEVLPPLDHAVVPAVACSPPGRPSARSTSRNWRAATSERPPFGARNRSR